MNLGGALTIAAPFVGGAIGGIAEYFGGREQNASAKEIATNQMNFQERMSGSAHQREVADLRAAGLNPVLSANAGASTPVGASAPVVNPLAGVGKAVSTALQIRQMKKDFEEADSRIAMNKGALMLQDSQRQAALSSARAAIANEKNIEVDTARNKLDLDWVNENPKWFQMKKALEVIGPVINSASGLSSTYRNIKGYIPKSEKFDGKFERDSDAYTGAPRRR